MLPHQKASCQVVFAACGIDGNHCTQYQVASMNRKEVQHQHSCGCTPSIGNQIRLVKKGVKWCKCGSTHPMNMNLHGTLFASKYVVPHPHPRYSVHPSPSSEEQIKGVMKMHPRVVDVVISTWGRQTISLGVFRHFAHQHGEIEIN